MKSKLLFLVLLMLLLNYVYSLEVDIEEVKKTKKIEFENYTGTHRVEDSARSIRFIGIYLADFKSDNEVFRYHMKYSIIHAVDNKNDKKLSADIISIDTDALVDHINNIRLIISGYLERRYGYTRKQSDALAVFITYYNAYYYKDMKYFSGLYKDIVLRNINETNAGLSTKYYEWPGNSKIIIPLTDKILESKDNLLELDELSDEKIVEEIRKEKDKKIDERKEIVKLKEDDNKDKKKEIEKEKKDIDKNIKEIEEEKKELEKEKLDIKKKEEEINKEKEEIKDIKDNKLKEEKKKEIKEDEKELKEKKEEVKKKEEELKKEEEKIVKKQEEIKEKEKIVDNKQIELNKEKDVIKKDENQLKKEEKKTDEKIVKNDITIQKEKELEKKENELKLKEEKLIEESKRDEKVFEDKFYYLKIKDFTVSGHYTNEMYIIDAANMKILKKSPVDKICGFKYLVYQEGVVVITFTTTHDSDHNLSLLDLNTLEVKKTGKDNIYFRSFIEEFDNNIYAIVKNLDDYYLAKFNKNLERLAISTEKVDFSTFITFYKDKIYVNSEKKDIIVLKNTDLTKIGVVNP